MAIVRYIVVEGPIGVGKTSLANLLAKEFEAETLLERPDENPFLEKFYKEREKYAFQTQIFFLLDRFRQQQKITQPDLFSKGIVSDYLFAKDRIFAYLNLDEDEIKLYEKIYRLLDARIVHPDLVIYLQARVEVLLQRIQMGRIPYQQYLTYRYLESLSQAYNSFFFNYNETPLLVVNTSEIDFVHNQPDFTTLVKEIKKARKGTRYLNIGRGVSKL